MVCRNKYNIYSNINWQSLRAPVLFAWSRQYVHVIRNNPPSIRTLKTENENYISEKDFIFYQVWGDHLVVGRLRTCSRGQCLVYVLYGAGPSIMRLSAMLHYLHKWLPSINNCSRGLKIFTEMFCINPGDLTRSPASRSKNFPGWIWYS